MSATFELAAAWVLRIEGGYVNDPADAGGETNYGISKRAYPDLDIAALTVDDATAIYRRDYWERYRCNELPSGLDLFLFDSVVQHRPQSAVRLVQRTVGAVQDGLMGPATVAAAARAVAAHGASTLLHDMFADRAELYRAIVTANSTQAKFARGWIRRLFMLHSYMHTVRLVE